MAESSGSPHNMRYHIVLVPGFAGFDALGQLEYYAGVTPEFEKWNVNRPDVALHYFDNFPTAGVITRATRLRTYLARRLARGEIAPGDVVSLVGHSTGGLDIRWLLWGLSGNAGGAPCPIRVDVGSTVEPSDLLDAIQRVVFLSVPHWGTNIADWVRAHKVWREAIVAQLRLAVAGSQTYILDQIEERATGLAACLTDADLLLAVEDSLAEANACNGERTALRALAAHEAASELALYLRQMAADFHAIDDLSSRRPRGGAVSPAHFDDAEREKELAFWEGQKIRVRSFATIGGRPFDFPLGEPAPIWTLTDLCTYPESTKKGPQSAGTDIAYRIGYRACAGGPLGYPELSGKVRRRLGACPPPPMELWDNDGIVNTVSMLWPRGENIETAGDHLDIVGHYHLVKAPPGAGRRYEAYDLLGSSPLFSDPMFTQVWTEIFNFCS